MRSLTPLAAALPVTASRAAHGAERMTATMWVGNNGRSLEGRSIQVNEPQWLFRGGRKDEMIKRDGRPTEQGKELERKPCLY